MICSAFSIIGKKRKENQDSFVIAEVGNVSSVFVVCDGMGGVAGGKVASSLASKTFVSYLKNRFSDTMTEDEIQTLLTSAVDEANFTVFKKSELEKDLNGMGTTLVAALVTENKVYTVNVGDSRLYEINDGDIRQMTIDHTYVRYLLDIGEINLDEVDKSPYKHMITRAVGTMSSCEPDIFVSDRKGQEIVLCSDGFHGALSVKEIVNNLDFTDYSALESSVRKTVDLANEKDGSDNITVIAAKL